MPVIAVLVVVLALLSFLSLLAPASFFLDVFLVLRNHRGMIVAILVVAITLLLMWLLSLISLLCVERSVCGCAFVAACWTAACLLLFSSFSVLC